MVERTAKTLPMRGGGVNCCRNVMKGGPTIGIATPNNTMDSTCSTTLSQDKSAKNNLKLAIGSKHSTKIHVKLRGVDPRAQRRDIPVSATLITARTNP